MGDFYSHVMKGFGGAIALEQLPGKGKALIAKQAFAPGDVLYVESAPLVSMQMARNAEAAALCGQCMRFMGSLQHQLNKVVTVRVPPVSNHLAAEERADMDAEFKESFPAIPEGELLPALADQEAATLSAIVPCTMGCGVSYCSAGCRDRAWRSHHLLLCPGFNAEKATAASAGGGCGGAGGACSGHDDHHHQAHASTDGEGVNAASLFTQQAMQTNEVLLMAGKAVGRVLEAWVRNGNDLVAAMRPFTELHSKPWADVILLGMEGEEAKRVIESKVGDEEEEEEGEHAGDHHLGKTKATAHGHEEEGHGHHHHHHDERCGGAGVCEEDEEDDCCHDDDAPVEDITDPSYRAHMRGEIQEWLVDSLTILKALVRERLPHIVEAIESWQAAAAAAGGAGGAAAAARPPSARTLRDFEEDALLSLDFYSHLLGAFDLNDIEVKIDSPLRDYFEVIKSLPKTGKASGGGAGGEKGGKKGGTKAKASSGGSAKKSSPYDEAVEVLTPLLLQADEAMRQRRRLWKGLVEGEDLDSDDEASVDSDFDPESDSEDEDDDDDDDEGSVVDEDEDDGDSTDKDPLSTYNLRRVLPLGKGTALFSVVACMNHSCAPNVHVCYADGSIAAAVIAKRPIAAGDELCINYVGLRQPYWARRADLTHYGFECGCPKCAAEEEAASEEVKAAVAEGKAAATVGSKSGAGGAGAE